MGDDEVEKHNPTAASIFKALGDENRWRILETLKEGERGACVLLTRMQISQSTLSYHMRILCDSGIVSSRTEGKWTHYRICPEGSKRAQARLLALTQQSLCPSGGCQCGK